MCGTSPLFLSQHFQAQNNVAGKKMTTTGNHIGHLYLQLLLVVKSLQNVVVRNRAAQETVNVLSLAWHSAVVHVKSNSLTVITLTCKKKIKKKNN